jgi:type I restriction enzyme M protein
MLTQELKSSIQNLWDKFWSGGIANPLVAIEQITYLIFMRRLEVLDSQHEQHAKTKGEKFKSVFKKHEDCRWSYWKNMSAEDMLNHVQTIVFPFIQNLDGEEDTLYSKYMKGATFMIQKPSLLQEAVSIFDELNITNQNQDTQGDIYEYLLSKLNISGQNGQFRTPRHIIRMIIEIVNPQLGETVCDPACGTGGFLINAYEYIVKNNTSEDLINYDEDGTAHNLIGDKITKKTHWDLLKNKSFFGYDFDYTMIRIGLMNMILHGIKTPNINYADGLSKNFDQKKQYDIILANPPFAGSVDVNDTHDDFKIKTSKTEILFLQLFYNIIKSSGGRVGVIVPNGALSGSSKKHQKVRELLMDNCQIDAIISMPSGVFKPYSGVSTSIIFFTKGGKTEDVWFYQMDSDGFTLDDKRSPITKNDIPDILNKIQTRKKSEKSWKIDRNEIKENDWNLTASRYKPYKPTNLSYPDPKKILEKIDTIELDIVKDLKILKKLLS